MVGLRRAFILSVRWFQEMKDWQWKQAMDYLSAVTELNYMTQIVIMLYEDNDKVGRDERALVFCQRDALVSLRGLVCVADRSPPQRSVSMSSCTSVRESKGVRTRSSLWASVSVPPPRRYVC